MLKRAIEAAPAPTTRVRQSTYPESKETDPPALSDKIHEAELARLLEQFEGTDNKEKTSATTSGSSPTSKAKRKSKIEDYDAWHGWDGESDKAPHSGPSSGNNEVDRYISDVLSDVAKSKAAREKVAKEEHAVKNGVSPAKSQQGLSDPTFQEDRKRDISFDGKITGTLGIPESPVPLRPSPFRESDNAKTPREAKVFVASSKTSTFSKAEVAALAKKLQVRLDEEIKRLRVQKEDVKRALSTRAREFGKDAQVQLGLLGGKVNEVTGYNEIERLKQDVRERELDIARLREKAAQAKDAYDQAVTARNVSQRDLTSLLERKHTWTDADISNFTNLVRSDHNLNHAVTSAKDALKKAELEVDKAFTALLNSILHRYHEEQVWSDKIRSVSTYGSLIVLVINLIVFLGAIAVVEPWKRRRLVRGLEEQVKGMVEDVEHTVTGEFEEVKSNMASVSATLAALQTAMAHDQVRQTGARSVALPAVSEATPAASAGSRGTKTGNSRALDEAVERSALQNKSALLPESTIQVINAISPSAASFVAQQDPHRIDMAIIGFIGLVTGTAMTAIIQSMR
ncbi:hypothetical protein NliqN6_4817 [Naganishia liquefaciens]|uniref:Sensitive to high expression protein 9, mitochondrial n=1 Tax=Naganishia liquefaciens TaxID=104408 RepID=A0A8H3TWB4_9TREE|nr:hypothetical protein NliqN6_4817 [Naganishia liquefaciens]